MKARIVELVERSGAWHVESINEHMVVMDSYVYFDAHIGRLICDYSLSVQMKRDGVYHIVIKGENDKFAPDIKVEKMVGVKWVSVVRSLSDMGIDVDSLVEGQLSNKTMEDWQGWAYPIVERIVEYVKVHCP